MSLNATNKKKLGASELSLFCGQLGAFLLSGISLSEGLEIMSEDIESRRLQITLRELSKAIHDRKTLSEGMELCGAFPEYLIKMVVIGEVSGNLEKIMPSLARFYEKQQRVNEYITNAAVYPLILILMMCAVVLLLATQVLPMLGDMLASFGGEMPVIAMALMNGGKFISGNYIILLSLFIALLIFYLICRKTASGRLTLDKLKAVFPLTRGLYRKITAGRFSSAMTFLTSGDIDMELSLKMAGDSLSNTYISNKIEECRKNSAYGEPVYEILNRSGMFPNRFLKMLSIGFKTGDSDAVMRRLADTYEHEVEKSLTRITDSIEPVFVIFLSLITGVILISTVLPLVRIMSLIG
ncbi:MAG: type II secretion system F family protein [Acidobacteriota bacterium]|jgi:type IV pilus assembly protein PilC|nr:type II secretion system F family protein [Acidobacteriota bacterium]